MSFTHYLVELVEDVEEDDSEKHQKDLDDGGDTTCWTSDNNFRTVGRGTGTSNDLRTLSTNSEKYPNKI